MTWLLLANSRRKPRGPKVAPTGLVRRQWVADRLRRWLREPLLHFLLIGALIFIAYDRLNVSAAEDISRTGSC